MVRQECPTYWEVENRERVVPLPLAQEPLTLRPFFSSGEEGDHEGVVEGDLVTEVVGRIGGGGAQQTPFYQIENYLPDIKALLEAPAGHHLGGHGTKFLQGQFAKALQ